MKQIFILLIAMTIGANAQTITTGQVPFIDANTTAIVEVSPSTVTFTLTGPNDRFFALAYGSFTNGMNAGNDIMWYNGTTIIDGETIGFTVPSADTNNNLTLVSDTNNSPSAGLRTLVISRNLDTGDAGDWVFSNSDFNIDLAMMQAGSATFTLGAHGGGSNADQALNTPLSSVLGVDDFNRLEDQIQLVNNQGKDLIIKSGNHQIKSLNVYNNLGQLILKGNGNNLDINTLENGVYFTEIMIEDGRIVYKKFIK